MGNHEFLRSPLAGLVTVTEDCFAYIVCYALNLRNEYIYRGGVCVCVCSLWSLVINENNVNEQT